MQKMTYKQNKRSDRDTQYDIEIYEKAQETYRAFAEKVAEATEKNNASVNYPIHWLYSSTSKKDSSNTQTPSQS